jgi:hypothetical protein
MEREETGIEMLLGEPEIVAWLAGDDRGERAPESGDGDE